MVSLPVRRVWCDSPSVYAGTVRPGWMTNLKSCNTSRHQLRQQSPVYCARTRILLRVLVAFYPGVRCMGWELGGESMSGTLVGPSDTIRSFVDALAGSLGHSSIT